MDASLLLLLVGFVVFYVAGILTHKYAVSEAEKIKAHVTAEIQEVRGDAADLRARVSELLKRLAEKV
jgi:sensor domain CHASE-containing protein